MTDICKQHIQLNTSKSELCIPEDLRDIAPYDDSCFHDKLTSLVAEPGFEHAVRFIMPDVDYKAFCENLMSVKNQSDFQQRIMGDFLEMLVKRTTNGLSVSGIENISKDESYTFLSNHRDIVLDASFLNLCLIRQKFPLTQVAIGNNLLITDWITDLVKLNRSFIVKRDVKKLQALEAAKQLSKYIHFTVSERKESVWIAQRQGRAKDSNDVTQESLVKMLAISGGEDAKKSLTDINILPVSISYEYDPNDYLKVKEYLLRKRDPEFKKSQHDDLLSMETGLVGKKGRVHFHLGKSINRSLSEIEASARPVVVREACKLIDKTIHQGYKIYPCNYIAFDMLENTNRFKDSYNSDDLNNFKSYVSERLSLVDVENITESDYSFMQQMMLTMYANPLKNKMIACDESIFNL